MNYKIRINSASGVKRMLQRLVNEVYSKEIDLERAKVLNQLLKTMLDSIEASDMEEKIERLQAELEAMKNNE